MATPAVAFPSSATNDAGIGAAAWTQLTKASAADGDLTSATTNFTIASLTAGSPASNRLKLLYEGNVLQGVDADGSFAIPADATMVGIEAVCKLNQSGTIGSITDTEAKILKAGTAGGTSQSTGAALTNSTTTAFQERPVMYGSASNLWGNSIAPSDVGATGWGIGLQMTGDGVNTVTPALDTVMLKHYFTTPDLTCTLRSNAAEGTRQAPWIYHAHVQASRWHAWNPQDCLVVWELLSFPAGYTPDTITDPRDGLAAAFQTVGIARCYGFNYAVPCTVAGSYKVRATIYAPDMSEHSSAEETFTVSADARTHRYVNPAASGANDGTSLANAWTSPNSAVTWMNANPTGGWVHFEGGNTYTLSGSQTTFTNLSNFVVDTRSGSGTAAKFKRTSDGGNAMWVFAAPTRVVLDTIEHTSNALTDSTWGFSIEGAALNFATLNCKGSLLRSWNENSDDSNVRRRVFHFKPVLVDLYRYGFFIGKNMTDVVLYNPSFTTRGSDAGEACIRLMGNAGGSDTANGSARYNLLWPALNASSPSVSQAAIRTWTPWTHVYGSSAANLGQYSIGQDNDAVTMFATYVQRWHNVHNTPRSALTGVNFKIGALGALSDVCVANLTLDGASTGIVLAGSTSNNGGIRRIKVLNPWLSSLAGTDTVILCDSSTSYAGAATGWTVGNPLIPNRDPSVNNTARIIRQGQNDNGIDKVQGGVYQLENGGTLRTNWQFNNTAVNMATWITETGISNEIQSRLPISAIDADQYFSLTDYTFNGTVATGTSTTVFTLDASASAEDHFYVGGQMTVGANSAALVKSYVGATKTVTLNTALSGTPSTGAAVAFTRSFATERGNGKIAAALGAQTDYRGLFRDFSQSNTSPGPTSTEARPAAPASLAASPGSQRATLSFAAVSGGATYRIWRSTSGTTGGPWTLEHEQATNASYAVTGLVNATAYAFAVSVIDGVFNESALSAGVGVTPRAAGRLIGGGLVSAGRINSGLVN